MIELEVVLVELPRRWCDEGQRLVNILIEIIGVLALSWKKTATFNKNKLIKNVQTK